jgi:hypothetical protein
MGILLGIVFIISLFAVSKAMKEPGALPPIASQQGAIAAAYAAPTAGEATGSMSVVAQIFKVLGLILLIGLASLIAFFTFCVICVVVVNSM